MCAQILALLERQEKSHQVYSALLQDGHQVTLITSFDKAIAILHKLSFDMIISDVHLENGGSVFDFLRWVTSHPGTNKTPFVLFSTKPTPVGKYLEDGVRTSARMLGAKQYIGMDRFDANKFRKQIALLLRNDITVLKTRDSEAIQNEIGG